jgi:hypothetical protein
LEVEDKAERCAPRGEPKDSTHVRTMILPDCLIAIYITAEPPSAVYIMEKIARMFAQRHTSVIGPA